MQASNLQDVRPIALDKIKPHPRNNEFFIPPTADETKRLASDIDSHGLNHPIEVIKPVDEEEAYVLVKGESRVRAARDLGWSKIPAIVRTDTKDPMAPHVIQDLIRDNVAGRNIDELTIARCFRELKKAHHGRSKGSAPLRDVVASALNSTLSGRTLERRERLLELPRDFQDLYSAGQLTQQKAEMILSQDRTTRNQIYEAFRKHGYLDRALKDVGLLSTRKRSASDVVQKTLDRLCREVSKIHYRLSDFDEFFAESECHCDSVDYLADFFHRWQQHIEDSKDQS